jgi:hypothetical protein
MKYVLPLQRGWMCDCGRVNFPVQATRFKSFLQIRDYETFSSRHTAIHLFQVPTVFGNLVVIFIQIRSFSETKSIIKQAQQAFS